MFRNLEYWPAIGVLDDAGFARQLTLYDPALRRYAARLSASAADAEDLVQDTFLKCWSARHQFATDTNFVAWARTIMRNTFFTSLRRSRHEVDIADDQVEHLQVTAPAQLTALELKDAMSALDHLDAGQRSAVIMASNGVSLEHGAATLRIPVNTYKSWIHRGRKHLGRLLDGSETPSREFAKTRSTDEPSPNRGKASVKRSWVGVMIG